MARLVNTISHHRYSLLGGFSPRVYEGEAILWRSADSFSSTLKYGSQPVGAKDIYQSWGGL